MSDATTTTTTTAPPTTTTTAPPPTGGTTTPGTAPAPANGPWYGTFKDGDLKNYMDTKQFESPEVLAGAYRNYEKTKGVPQDRLLTLPEKMDAESLAPIYDRLGRPSKPEEYGIKPPEGGDPNYTKFVTELFHKQGLTKSQAENIVSQFDGYVAGKQKELQDARATKSQQEQETLKKEWGNAFEQNTNAAKSAAKAFGLDEKIIDALQDQLGFAGTMKFAFNLAQKLGEENFISGDKNGSFRANTPGGAQSKIDALKADKDFMKRWSNGDREAKETWNKLHEEAYPESA